jgi:hypothetical protein
LTDVEKELANLAETAARGGAVPAVFDALEQRDEERRRLVSELAALQTEPASTGGVSALRERLRGFLSDWDGLLASHVAEARPLLDVVLAESIAFRPTLDGNGYQLTVPIAFDRVMTAAVPELSRLQDRVASPTRTVNGCNVPFAGVAA